MGRKNVNAIKGMRAKPSKAAALAAKRETERLVALSKAHKTEREFYSVSSHLSSETLSALAKYKVEIFG